MKQYTTNKLAKIAKQCMEHVKCDTARISRPLDKMYLIIGFNRNTKEGENVRFMNREQIEYNYLQEIIVANGNTEEELIASAKESQRLCELAWKEHFKELRKERV